MVEQTWFDFNTKKVLSESEAQYVSGVGGASFGGGGFGGPNVGMKEFPDRYQFMVLGHLLWALLWGYVGGRFAGWVYDRRMRREDTSGETTG